MYVQGGLIPTYLQVSRMNLVDTLWGLILPNAIISTYMIIMRTYFQTSLPESLHEAAVLDGCNYTCYLLKIVLPLSLPILAVVGLYYAVGHWNNYFDALHLPAFPRQAESPACLTRYSSRQPSQFR